MKFDLAYCLSLDDKLSIYDVRDLNFDETVAFDSAKEHFRAPTMPVVPRSRPPTSWARSTPRM